MSKGYKKIVLALTLVLVLLTMTGCGSKEPDPFTATTSFYYSSDGGRNYGNGAKEYEVGKNVYLKLQYKVTSGDSEKKPTPVKVTLTIPKVEFVDANYMDGQKITGRYDQVKNQTTFVFTAYASKNASTSEAVFQFIPNGEGQVKLTVDYDDNVASTYDRVNTLTFVKGND